MVFIKDRQWARLYIFLTFIKLIFVFWGGGGTWRMGVLYTRKDIKVQTKPNIQELAIQPDSIPEKIMEFNFWLQIGWFQISITWSLFDTHKIILKVPVASYNFDQLSSAIMTISQIKANGFILHKSNMSYLPSHSISPYSFSFITTSAMVHWDEIQRSGGWNPQEFLVVVISS